jgi:hypothetical protein
VPEHQRGDFAGLLVAAIIGEVVAPPHRLGVEVEQVGESTAAVEGFYLNLIDQLLGVA